VELTQSIIVQSPAHTWEAGRHQARLLAARMIRNPAERMANIQEHMFWIAYHQSRMYRRLDQSQTIPLQAAADVKVRSLQPPVLFDAKGKPRPPTAKELKELKGPDPNLPGYTADFVLLKPGLPVEVYLARIDALQKFREGSTGPSADAPLEVVLIVIGARAP